MARRKTKNEDEITQEIDGDVTSEKLEKYIPENSDGIEIDSVDQDIPTEEVIQESGTVNPKTVDKPAGQSVPLAVYLQVCGLKADQTAGFKYHAVKQMLGPLPVPAWRAEFDKFMGKPVK